MNSRATFFVSIFTALQWMSPGVLRADSFERKVTVSGECNLEVEPDRGSVIMVADAQAPDAKTAIKRATELHEKLRSDLRKSKVKNLELTQAEYSVQEVTAWENNKSVSKGFQCRIGLRAVTPEISAMGEVLAIAADAGVRNTHSLQTYLSEGRVLDQKKNCLVIAAKNAREKATELVKALGGRLGSVLKIEEKSGAEPQPGPFMMESVPMRSKAMPAPTIEAAKQNIHHEVLVTFQIEV
ncbi:MAG: SIMPL domain-containing protein [Bdellovibrionales bacterium]|nr:SIMPL domain-containing protein [Bdellovibrionales bacterium]